MRITSFGLCFCWRSERQHIVDWLESVCHDLTANCLFMSDFHTDNEPFQGCIREHSYPIWGLISMIFDFWFSSSDLFKFWTMKKKKKNKKRSVSSPARHKGKSMKEKKNSLTKPLKFKHKMGSSKYLLISKKEKNMTSFCSAARRYIDFIFVHYFNVFRLELMSE